MAELENIPTRELIDELMKRYRGDFFTIELERFWEGLGQNAFNYGERLQEFEAERMWKAKPQTAYRTLKEKDLFRYFYLGYVGRETWEGIRKRIDKYFPRAIERGYITLNETGCDWHKIKIGERGGKTEFAVFLLLLTGGADIHFADIERLFGVYSLWKAVSDIKEMPQRDFTNNKYKIRLEKDIFYD